MKRGRKEHRVKRMGERTQGGEGGREREVAAPAVLSGPNLGFSFGIGVGIVRKTR